MGKTTQGSIALEGPARSGKTRRLLERTQQLLAENASDSVLVLCSNYLRKTRFLEALQENLTGGYAQLQITTYSALVRNTLALYWPCAEGLIVGQGKLSGKPTIFPELSGFEATEYLVKKIVLNYQHHNPDAFREFKGSLNSLVKQLIRRIRLKSENQLTGKAMQHRSSLIGEPCMEDVAYVLREFDRWSAQLRVFDNSKQIDVFHKLLETQPEVQAYFSPRIKHLVVDDVDETIPAQQHFIKWLAPKVETLTIAADIDGGTRRGYLNAYPYDWLGLKALKPEMETITLTRDDPFAHIADQLLKNWTHPDPMAPPAPLPVEREFQWRPQSLTRMDMLNQVVSDINRLLRLEPEQAGGRAILPSDIVIVMPRVDVLARLQLEHQLKSRGIPLQILTGTQRPTDHPVCQSLLLLLQLLHQDSWEMPLSALEFKALLRNGLRLHEVDPTGLEDLTQAYRVRTSSLLPQMLTLLPEAQARYTRLLTWLEKARDLPFEEAIYSAFGTLLTPYLTEHDALGDMGQMLRSLYIKDMALVFLGGGEENALAAAKNWLIQVKTGIVADTPNKPKDLDPDAIVLGTPQKVIDFEIERRVHLWLDVSAREWSRTDNAPLYNAWVHSVNWDGDTTQASDSFNQHLTRTRAGHITRTLTLYAGEKVLLYASELDDEGNPNTGIFQYMLAFSGNVDHAPIARATLRDDQAKVLTYTEGPMAITAVPGAGKTFVNVELLLELIERGVQPEQILVLTYMDSAARTLLSRLKTKLQHRGTTLPAVSTIHSLAFRIITEADHAVYLGLDADNIAVMDELETREILNPIIQWADNGENDVASTDAVLSGMQLAKAHGLTPEIFRQRCEEKGVRGGRLLKFARIYETYQEQLRKQGKLDFTDLILNAITLLETMPEVRQKYQERFRYIIEDEAQDSSLMLQRFIHLLQGTHGNLIRTGDTNQSITTTFSTADTSVFRRFIAECRDNGLVIDMDQSGRCAEPVITLANRFMDWACEDDILREAFQPVVMKPVPGKNPALLEPLMAMTFETQDDEQSWLVEQIQTLQAQYPEQSIAVLLRSNPEVLNATRLLQGQGIKAISYSESPQLSPIFLIVVHVLAHLENPADSANLYTLCSLLKEHFLMPLTEADLALIEHRLFASLTPEDLKQSGLLQLHYHVADLLRYAYGQDMCRLIVRLSDLFFSDPQHRSLGYLCALKAQEWVNIQAETGVMTYSPLEWVNQKFGQCINRKKLPIRKFQEGSEVSGHLKNRFVQVMTLHKSKGQEFDFVFIPGLTERGFPSVPESIKWREGDRLEMDIDQLRMNEPKDRSVVEAEKKRQKLEEEARLIYVGLTRARQGLYLSCPLEGRNYWGKKEAFTPSRYFDALKSILTEPMPPRTVEEVTHAG